MGEAFEAKLRWCCRAWKRLYLFAHKVVDEKFLVKQLESVTPFMIFSIMYTTYEGPTTTTKTFITS